MSDREYKGGYRYPYATRRMVEDKEATKNDAYSMLEDMANEMIKFMDSNGIDIFEYNIHSPQRKKAWTIIADTKVTSGRYKWLDTDPDSGCQVDTDPDSGCQVIW